MQRDSYLRRETVMILSMLTSAERQLSPQRDSYDPEYADISRETALTLSMPTSAEQVMLALLLVLAVFLFWFVFYMIHNKLVLTVSIVCVWAVTRGVCTRQPQRGWGKTTIPCVCVCVFSSADRATTASFTTHT